MVFHHQYFFQYSDFFFLQLIGTRWSGREKTGLVFIKHVVAMKQIVHMFENKTFQYFAILLTKLYNDTGL